MAYTPTNWNTGDTITATKLNKLENGVANAGSALICDIENGGSLNKTYAEIWDALADGIPVYIRIIYGDYTNYYQSTCNLCPVLSAYKYDTAYRIHCAKASQHGTSGSTGITYPHESALNIFEASSPSSYPTYLTTIAPASSIGYSSMTF